MEPITWKKIVEAAAAAGVREQELYDNSSLRSKFAAAVGRRGGQKTATKRRRQMSAKVAAIKPKQLTLNLF